MTTYSMMSQTDPQAILDSHPIAAADGRCVRCAVEGPCHLRWAALHVIAARDELPRRLPGATRPELVNARRVRVGA